MTPPEYSNHTVANARIHAGNRLRSWDLLKTFAIFLVIWGHVEQFLVSGAEADRTVYRTIYSFHMPLFMTMAGFFYAMTLKSSIVRNILDKTRRLLLPWVTWFAITCLVIALLDEAFLSSPRPKIFFWQSYWFLKSAFACGLVALIPLTLPRRYFWSASLLTTVGCQLLVRVPVLNLPFMYPCFLLGIIIYRYYDKFYTYRKQLCVFCSIAWFICLLFLDGDAYRRFLGDYSMDVSHTKLDVLFWMSYRNLVGITGAVAFIALSEILFATNRFQNAFTDTMVRIGALTLGIYTVHTILIQFIMGHYVNFDFLPPFVFDFIISPAIAIVTLFICSAIVRITEKNRYTSWLLLGTRFPRKTATLSRTKVDADLSN